MVLIIVRCQSETDAAEGVIDNVLWRDDMQELNDGELLTVSFGKAEEICVRQRRQMSLETQTKRRESGGLDLATKTWK